MEKGRQQLLFYYYYYVVLRRINSFGHLARKKYKNMWN